MFAIDVPDFLNEKAPVSQVVTDHRLQNQKVAMTIGVCHLSENPYDVQSAVNTLSPAVMLRSYLWRIKRKRLGEVKLTAIQSPKHGKLEDIGKESFAYYPDKDFKGRDRARMLAEVDGVVIRIEYFFQVVQSIPQDYEDGPSPYKLSGCPNIQHVWKISAPSK